MVSKEQAMLLEDFLKQENIPGRILIPNVQKAIDAEIEMNSNISNKWPFWKFDYTKFNRFDAVSLI